MTYGLNVGGTDMRLYAPHEGGWVLVLGSAPRPIGGDDGGGTGPIVDGGDMVQPRHDPAPPDGPDMNVATTMSQSMNRVTVPTSGTAVSLSKHVLAVDVTAIRLAWVVTRGWYTAEQGGTMRAWVEGAGMTRTQLTFGGATSVQVAAPADVATYTTDPVDVSWIAGDRITVRVEVDAPAGVTVPGDSTGRTPADPTGGDGFIRPSRIVAPSDKTAWVVIGDSIAQQAYSYGEQALSRLGLAAVKSAVGGDGYIYWGSQGGRFTGRVSPHATYATHLLDTLGMNDRDTTRALDTWRYARENTDLRIVKTTVNPDTKDRDFSTTTSTREPSRHEFNEWLRDGAPILADWSAPLATGTTDPNAIRCRVVSYDGSTAVDGDAGHILEAVSDAAAAIEQSRENPVYSDVALGIIGSGDSLHPAPGVHALMADRIMADLRLLGFA